MKNALWWLIGASRGGTSRAQILKALKEKPCTAPQLVERLKLDYTTVRFHLRLLVKNDAVTTVGEKYNQMYALTPLMESHWGLFEEIVKQIKEDEAPAPPPPAPTEGAP